MQKTEIIKSLAKGSPGATIIMSPRDLDGFARAVIEDYKLKTGETKRRGLSKTSEQAEIIQALREVWPNTNCTQLARALGVSKMWIYKLLKVDVSNTLPNDEGLTLSDAADVLAGMKDFPDVAEN